MKVFFHSIVSEICSHGSNYQYASIGSDDGLAPIRGQAIIWTNGDLVYWRIYASLCFNELNCNWNSQSGGWTIYDVASKSWVSGSSVMLLGTLGPAQMADIMQTTFLTTFSWNSLFAFWFKYHQILFLTVKLTIIVSGYGLGPNMRQYIARYNADPVLGRCMVSPVVPFTNMV